MRQFLFNRLILWIIFTAAVELTGIASGTVAGAPESGRWSNWQVWFQDQRTSRGTDQFFCLSFSGNL